MAKPLGIRFVGCPSLRFNFAVQDVVRKQQEVVDRIKSIISKLFSATRRAKLRQSTEFSLLRCNKKRMSSVNSMLSRYIQVLD